MLLVTAGCQSSGEPRQLDPLGAYQGDLFLWSTDGVIEDLDRIYDEVEGLAARNPSVFQSSESLTQLLDRVRRERDGVPDPTGELLTTLLLARDTYAAAKTSENVSALQRQLNLARAFLEQARVILPQLITTE